MVPNPRWLSGGIETARIPLPRDAGKELERPRFAFDIVLYQRGRSKSNQGDKVRNGIMGMNQRTYWGLGSGKEGRGCLSEYLAGRRAAGAALPQFCLSTAGQEPLL